MLDDWVICNPDTVLLVTRICCGLVLLTAAVVSLAVRTILWSKPRETNEQSLTMNGEASPSAVRPERPSRETDIDAVVIPELSRRDFRELPYPESSMSDIPPGCRNKACNRFRNIVPYSKNRAVLPMLSPGDLDSTYVNASLISGADGVPKKYIMAMGPLPTSVGQFWRMVWQHGCVAIIMVTELVEGGKTKCHKYWPDEDDGEESFDDQPEPIVLVCKSHVECNGYEVTTLGLRRGDKARTVKHFWYRAWGDHGLPESPDGSPDPDGILAMRAEAWRWQCNHPAVAKRNVRVPLLVHCSAGVGRAGTFVAIDHGIDSIESHRKANVLEIVAGLREQRTGVVQTYEQAEFVRAAIVGHAVRLGHIISTTSSLGIDFDDAGTLHDAMKWSGSPDTAHGADSDPGHGTPDHDAPSIASDDSPTKSEMRKLSTSSLGSAGYGWEEGDQAGD